MKNIFIFTHIPKTAGTSFINSILYNNFDKINLYKYQGFKNLLLKDKKKIDVFMGHFPYGGHHFFPGSPKYFTFLREPIQRAISHYYWVKQTKSNNYEHPEWKFYDSTPLVDLFSKTKKSSFYFFPLKDNLQTRYLAGLRHGFWLTNKDQMLDVAKKNLEKYQLLGIQEYYQDSINLFETYFGWSFAPTQREKSTSSKPVSFDKSVVQVLEENHSLDQEIYKMGVEIFNDKLSRKPCLN
ncbi:sulfotransferase family 2 domain-containing protein [Cytophagaceae bacterium ABcell3]|nr:sulfotransferase family 2 domain-containing protein [Cytophagaceae bacterium ABcell3]